MTKTRKLLITVILLLVATGCVLFFFLRTSATPEIARLLPEGEMVLYANLKPVHFFWQASKPVQIEGDYHDFINQTGIDVERDLDEVAMSRRDTPDGRDSESSEIVAGRFDRLRFENYLIKISASQEDYSGHKTFVVPHEGHIVRVTILNANRVAVTNMASAEVMHQMIDASKKPTAGPSLLQSFHEKIPLGSLAWAIVRTGSSAKTQPPSGWSFDFLDNTVTVASLRYKGDLLVRADVIAGTEKEAKQVVDSAASFVSMYRTVARSVGTKGADPDVKAAIDSITVEQKENIATFSATLPQRMFKKLFSEAQSLAAAAATPSSTPAPSPAASSKKSKGKN
jgi:hypothetical protein